MHVNDGQGYLKRKGYHPSQNGDQPRNQARKEARQNLNPPETTGTKTTTNNRDKIKQTNTRTVSWSHRCPNVISYGKETKYLVPLPRLWRARTGGSRYAAKYGAILV